MQTEALRSDQQIPQELTATPERDAALQSLLGVDYDYARDSGLIDLFEYDPANPTTDGLMHVLVGERYRGEDGNEVYLGFHHEPSPLVKEGFYPGDRDKPILPTRVQENYRESLDSEGRRRYRQFPFEPYYDRVFIDGHPKITIITNPETGAAQEVKTNNGMFPKEYDPLTVLQTVRIALENARQEEFILDETNSVLVGNSVAPMLDGQSMMKVRLVLDPKTKKIISAYPLVKAGAMKLSRAAINHHLGLS